MNTLSRIADHLAAELTNLGFIIMSDSGGNNLPLVAYRLPPNEDRLYDEYALAHVLRQRGWIVPAYTMAPKANNLKMMRVVLRDDFSMNRCEALIADIKMAMKSLDDMDAQMIQKYMEYVGSFFFFFFFLSRLRSVCWADP